MLSDEGAACLDGSALSCVLPFLRPQELGTAQVGTAAWTLHVQQATNVAGARGKAPESFRQLAVHSISATARRIHTAAAAAAATVAVPLPPPMPAGRLPRLAGHCRR